MKLFTLKMAQVGFFCCLLCESKLMLTPALLNYGSPICSHSVQSFWPSLPRDQDRSISKRLSVITYYLNSLQWLRGIGKEMKGLTRRCSSERRASGSKPSPSMPLQAQVASHRIQLLHSLQRHADLTYIQVNAKASYRGK